MEERWSNKHTLEVIRKIRNDLIRDFLDERFLLNYVATEYHRKELEPMKVQEIRTDLKERLIQEINCEHYKTVIAIINENHAADVSLKSKNLFYKEIDIIIFNHIYS